MAIAPHALLIGIDDPHILVSTAPSPTEDGGPRTEHGRARGPGPRYFIMLGLFSR